MGAPTIPVSGADAQILNHIVTPPPQTEINNPLFIKGLPGAEFLAGGTALANSVE